ncbi:hypothetical protein NQ314_007038 [Rhamnusium bicolor]|uniref:Citrate transporter-like domain-containing protein n=1 Tax=Rhamnusium bicolor TaxID=1586634 RepID=A0AAV8YVE8_9CUCU|nr:hypothetical protein NQ314_007038 [Rhamnusium bicolor]
MEKEISLRKPALQAKESKLCGKNFKIFSLVLIWQIYYHLFLSILDYNIFKNPRNNKIRVVVEGALLPPYYSNLSAEWMSIWVQLMVLKQKPSSTSRIKSSDVLSVQNVSEAWYVPLVTEKLIGQVPEVEHKKIFHLTSYKIDNRSYNLFRIQLRTNLDANFPVSMGLNLQPINPDDGIIYAALVLVGLYILIIFDLIHRTLAAMLASTMSVAILAALNERPTMSEIISWIDIETLLLLFSMMTLVTIFSETGIFDHTAVYAYKITGGKLWPLINMLCVLTTVLSCFLDNVTTSLLITPVTIKLCEVMKLNPRQILMYTLMFANIGGASTPIGDPPNVLIASNPDVIKTGINFGVFTLHMGIGAMLALIVIYIQIRIMYRDMSYYKFDEPPVVQGRLGLGWTALLGVLLLLLLYDNQDLEGIFARVEWSTLLFFASLFILMEVSQNISL